MLTRTRPAFHELPLTRRSLRSRHPLPAALRYAGRGKERAARSAVVA